MGFWDSQTAESKKYRSKDDSMKSSTPTLHNYIMTKKTMLPVYGFILLCFLLFAVLLAGWNHVIYMYLLAAATFCRFSMKNQWTTCDMYCDLTSVICNGKAEQQRKGFRRITYMHMHSHAHTYTHLTHLL